MTVNQQVTVSIKMGRESSYIVHPSQTGVLAIDRWDELDAVKQIIQPLLIISHTNESSTPFSCSLPHFQCSEWSVRQRCSSSHWTRHSEFQRMTKGDPSLRSICTMEFAAASKNTIPLGKKAKAASCILTFRFCKLRSEQCTRNFYTRHQTTPTRGAQTIL